MPKIKIIDPTLAPSYRVPRTGIEQKGVDRAQPTRPVSEGKEILSQIAGDLAKGTGDIAQYLAVYDAKTRKVRNAVEVSDRIADMENDLNQHYISNIASRRSGAAKDIFRDEIEVIEGMKRTALQEIDDEQLHGMLSLEFDKLAQKHLKKVFDHKIKQDEKYREDTAIKVAKNLQSEMSMFGLRNSGKALEVSNKINEKLANYPVLRDAAKMGAWKGFFKFNARIAPELTQKSYENKTMRKNIVNQIGAEGYNQIQEAIDKGRAIGIQDRAIAKQQHQENLDEETETTMEDAIHTYLTTPEKFNSNYIDKLKLPTMGKLPTPDKRILIGFLRSLVDDGKLSEAEVDWPTYDELLEDIRLVKLTKEKPLDIRRKVLDNMNRTITVDQGQYMLKALSNRDIFDTPVIQDAFDTVKEMYQQGRIEGLQYSAMIRGLTDTVIKHNGDTQKVQEYVQDVIDPSIRKGAWSRYWQDTFPNIFSPTPEFTYVQPRLTEYITEEERKSVNEILLTQPDKNGIIRTVDQIPDEILQQYLEYVRSSKYIEDQEKRK